MREPVVLLVHGGRYRGVVTRIGGGGVYVVTDAPADRDDQVLLRMRLPCFDKAEIFKGEVRWTSPERDVGGRYEPGGLGVMFTDVSPGIQRKIVEFVTDTGDMLYEVSGLLSTPDPDFVRIQAMLSNVQLDSIHTVDELREVLRAELKHYFDRF